MELVQEISTLPLKLMRKESVKIIFRQGEYANLKDPYVIIRPA